jgi:photoactive yellow protein
MLETTLLSFDDPGLAARLPLLTDSELDRLPFGVVEMNQAGHVVRYNATESRYTGLSRDRVVGRHFFQEVAPCSNNRHVAGRYGQVALDETLEYTFALRLKPVPVRLRLLKVVGRTHMFLLVKWT